MAKIIMIIAQNLFRDEELFVTRSELQKRGHHVEVAARQLALCHGNQGGSVMPDMTIADIRTDEWDALVFVGGGGASEYFKDAPVHRLAWDFYEKEKMVAAICIAPVILANAGLLENRRATVFPSGAPELAAGGASYTAEAVTQDGRIITGNGPRSSAAFAEKIDEALNKNRE